MIINDYVMCNQLIEFMYLTEIFKEDTKFMKFKRSHILLISLISIFLLLSLGAASAASVDSSADLAISDIDDLDIDNDVNDADALSQSGNDFISDDPTPDGEGGEGGDINDDPLPVSDTTIESGNESYKAGENITLNVSVKDNQSAEITNVTKDNLKVFIKDESSDFEEIDFTYNESQILLVFDDNYILPEGNYSVKIQFIDSIIDGISYMGNETIVNLNITRIDTHMTSNNVTYKFGDTLVINVTVYDENGNPINITAQDFKITYKKGTDGEIKQFKNFILNNESQIELKFEENQTLPVGNYTFNITFLDNPIYRTSDVVISLNITKTNTTINASDVKVKIGDDVIIPLVMKVESNKTLNFNASNMVVTYNGEEIEFVKVDGGIKLLNFEQDFENYIIEINYIGNTNCNPSSIAITVTILENNTIVINGTVNVDYQTHNITFPISVDGNGTILNVTEDDIVLVLVYYDGTDNITVNLDKESFDLTGEDGIYNISFVQNVPLNDAKLTVIYKNGDFNETKKTITFIESNTIITDNIIKVNNHTHNVTIPISINHTAIISVDGENVTVTTLNLTAADVILILYCDNGTDNYTINLTAADFDSFTGENGTYNISFSSDSILENIPLENITLENVTVTIVYGNGTLNETNKTVDLKLFIGGYIVSNITEADYQFGEYKFQLLDADTHDPLANQNITISGVYFYEISESGSVTLYMSKTLTTDEEGYIVFNNTFMHNNFVEGYTNMQSYNFTALPAGTYNLTFRSNGFLEVNNTTEITVNKINAKIIASNLVDEYGKTINYIFQVVNAATNEPIKVANVQFVINGTVVNATREGKTNLTGYYTSPNLTLSGGTYNLTLKSIDDSLICSAVKKTLTINPKAAVISASNRTIYFGSDYSAILKLTDKKTGKAVANAWVSFKVYTSSTKYTLFYGKTNSKGQVYLSTPLAVGKHKIVYQTVDTNYKASAITRYLTVKKASAKFTASKVSTYYNSGKIFKIKLTNTKTQKPIYGGKVNIKVFISKNKYYNLIGTTDGNGLVYLKVTYNPGTYKVVISSADKGYSAKALTSQIKVTKSPIKMAPTALKVKKGNYFKVKVTSTKSKKVLSGVKVKVKVYTGKKFKTYTIKTNKKGIASLKITQKVGKHKVVLSPAQTKLYSAKALTKTLTVTK